jgi:nucleotide-binding universal stress UspA family protein
VAEEVARSAPCPVLTIRELKKPEPVDAVQRILVPVDFSTHSRRSISYARELAASYDARLQLLHVVEQAVYPSFYSLNKDDFQSLLNDVEEAAMEHLHRVLDESPGPRVSAAEFHLIEGRAVTAIPDFAEANETDLIVIATHGLTGIDRLFLGGVAEKVIRRSNCPVFVVKAFGRSLIRGDRL